MNNFKITKREIIASISIMAVMILIGMLIAGKISDGVMDKNEKYNKALKIENTELFQYGIDTDIGNAFVYGELKAVDTVTYPEINGTYMYVKKVKEKYTRHTRVISTGTGKYRHTSIQTYWTWDKIDSEDKICKEVSFCGIVFDSKKFDVPEPEKIGMIKESSHIRYVYYGTKTEYKGTAFTNLKNKTINDTEFYKDMTITQTEEYLESDFYEVAFWIGWIVLICIIVFLFYWLDNNWLYSK